MNIIVPFLFVLTFSFITVNGTCVRNKRKPKRPSFKKHLEYIKTYPHGPNDAEYTFGPMRIKTYYIAFNDNYSKYFDFSPSITASEIQRAEVTEILDWVVNEIKKIIIGVRHVISPLHAPRHCLFKENNEEFFTDYKTICSTSVGEYCSKIGYCGDLRVPATHSDSCVEVDDDNNEKKSYEKGEGVTDADLLLYYSMANCNDTTLAFADICVTEINFGTPTVGAISICYDQFFSNDTRKNVGFWRSTILHELLHVLLDDLSGISYLDEKGNKRNNTFTIVPRKWRLKNGTYINYEALLSTLPSVVEFAKKHFNCSSLKGLDFQTDRPNYTKYGMEKRPFTPHVEHIFFPDALMAPYSESGVYITKLEAAFLKDTGWYTVNEAYDFAELTVTRNKGCIFVDMSCHDYMEYVNHDPVAMYPYCASKLETACSPDHRTAIECRLPTVDENKPDAKKYKKQHKDKDNEDDDEEEGDENDPDKVNDEDFDDWRASDCPYISGIGEVSSCFYKNAFYGSQEKLCIQMNDFFSNGSLNNSNGFCRTYSCKTDGIEISVDIDNVIECDREQIKKTFRLKKSSVSADAKTFDEFVCPDFSNVCQILRDGTSITTASPKGNCYVTDLLVFIYFWLR